MSTQASSDQRDRIVFICADTLEAILEAVLIAAGAASSSDPGRALLHVESIVEELRGRFDLEVGR